MAAHSQIEDEPKSPRQSIGLQELDTKEKSFRYLDFAESGANAALNKWGQFLQFSRLVVDDGDCDSWNYISVEPRHILRLEHIAPAMGSFNPDQEVNYSEDERRALGWAPDNPEWKPSVYHLNDSDAYQRKHDEFNTLCMQNQGLGLRFSGNTNISEPEHYYRNDRWPEVRYTVEGKVKVVLQYYIENGEIIQDMCLTSESTEETELTLEFELTTGIRVAPGNMRGPKEKRAEEHDFDHFLQQVLENGAPAGCQWRISRGNYYATASLFKDGQPKPFRLLRAGEQIDEAGCNIEIRSNDSIMHRETLILGPRAKTKFTSAFKIEHIGIRNTPPPQYFDISPRLESLQDRWWSFDTESSSFIFRRNLETILSHAMPLPRVKDEAFQPYVLQDHDLMNTFQTWSSSLNQVRYLLEIDKILQHPGKADEITTSHYRRRIREVIFGYFVWLLKYAESNGFPESILLHWSGKVIRKPREESADPANPSDTPGPFEPELSKYQDQFQNCCQFLVLLDMCLINYPNEEPLFTRMVKKFLKQAWEPIEMSKHRGSHLWPDNLERLGEYPPPYARFLDGGDYLHCGYGGQDIHVYVITTQVLVWRAIKSTKRLLALVHKDPNWSLWSIDQSLDDKAIRDRTIEVFRRDSTDTDHDYFPDRFFSKIRGHVKESFLDQWSCDIVVPSFVEDFFRNKDELFAWTETLRHYDAFGDSVMGTIINTWDSFLRYQVAVGQHRRQMFRESFEARAYSVGLFTNETITPGSHCPYATSWSVVTYLLASDHAKLPYPQFIIPMNTEPPNRGNRTSMFQPDGLQNAGVITGASVRISQALDTSVRHRRIKLGRRGKGLDLTAEELAQVNDPPSYGEWYWFREPFFMKHKPPKIEMNKNFVEEFLTPERNWSYFWDSIKGKNDFVKTMTEISNYDWGGSDGEWRVTEIKWTGEFISRLRLMDSQKMRFDDQTILPDNLWITEFNINFIIASNVCDTVGLFDPAYFPKKHAKFQGITAAVPGPDLMVIADAAIGFRIIGDLHDRYWTCYVFYDFGTKQLTPDARDKVANSDYGKTASQRKCLEGFLVHQALDLLILETKKILQVIAESVGAKEDRSQTLYTPLLTEDDLSEENFLTTMSKNSVFYPWLLRVYGALRDKCAKSRGVAELWLSAEKTRKYKPRWCENDQKEFGQDVAKKRREVKARCTMLEKLETNLNERIERIKILKESSIVAIQELNWASPAKTLARITLAVTFATFLLLMNLDFLHRKLAALIASVQKSIRQKMGEDSESSRVKSAYQEKRPAWKYWKNHAHRLSQVEHRKKSNDKDSDPKESGWWYWHFMAIFIIIVVPVQELTFIIRTLRRKKVKKSGPLKRLVRIPWAPIWVVQLAVVYIIMLVGYAVVFLVPLMHHAAVWLWNGNEEDELSPTREDERSLISQIDSPSEDIKPVSWWMRPAKTMQFAIVTQALRSERRVNDPERQNIHPST
ncbi:hypothetical protein L873DRAFT_1793824 [Choiromyces venosus 120613-1]|uniref:Uncharacterized protein n=1 Tax=Choiromyces venosus 120613-1 TaxID=1336337 RepID=A0A3N4J4F8_9PEZI|nr:hypothetical protein L873DRAFT_1793824 [Choiromyces venosus 120613-1]